MMLALETPSITYAEAAELTTWKVLAIVIVVVVAVAVAVAVVVVEV